MGELRNKKAHLDDMIRVNIPANSNDLKVLNELLYVSEHLDEVSFYDNLRKLKFESILELGADIDILVHRLSKRRNKITEIMSNSEARTWLMIELKEQRQIENEAIRKENEELNVTCWVF